MSCGVVSCISVRQLREIQQEMALVEAKLDAIAATDARVALLRTIREWACGYPKPSWPYWTSRSGFAKPVK